MNKVFNSSKLKASPRIAYQACIIIGIFFFFGCSKSALDDVPADKSMQKSSNRSPKVTWSYLQWMASSGQNPSIAKYLEVNKHLIPKSSNARDGAPVTNGGNDGDDDPENPGDCDSGKLGCVGDPEGGGATWRVDIPFTVNNQQMYISIVVVYDSATGQPTAAGTQVYGNNVPVTSNYVSPTATFSNGQMTFIGNIAYSYTTGINYSIGAELSGAGTLAGSGITATVNGNTGQQYTMTTTGTIYVNFSVNMSSSYGSGMVQINGVNGQSYYYGLSPDN